MPTATWKKDIETVETRYISGTKDLSATLVSGTAVVDASDTDGYRGQAKVTLTTSDEHGISGGYIYLEGTTNYDGTHEIVSTTTSGITVKVDKYTAETPVGTETVGFVVDPECEFVLLEVNLHLSAAAATSENFVCTLDANAGSAHDEVIISEDVSGHADLIWYLEKYCMNGDKLRFTLTNTDGRTYGLEVKYRRIR